MIMLDLLRHGETELGHTLRGSTDDALTLQGWQDMQQTLNTAISTGQRWDIVASSPLQRCVQVAQTFALEQQLPLYIDAQFQEMHFGAWEAISTQTLYEQYPEDLAKFWMTPTQFSPPQAESLLSFQQRVLQGLSDLNQYLQQLEQQPKRVLLVTHGGVIKLLKVLTQKQPLDDILKMSAALGQLSSFQLHPNGNICIQGQT
ncbi:MAG: histidine phosphatase family protein [Acinetobacter sp.]|uniref:histidine phosphatase family protein n=1 Tax=Acinetobacter sp. TaxID=472 RepID=UPI0026E07CEC|nr:histidine phosphatase family protein [Acinetobacter sp.]MDO5543291.1 histidine phosphatase family protein [Acinetobacter sp.]